MASIVCIAFPCTIILFLNFNYKTFNHEIHETLEKGLKRVYFVFLVCFVVNIYFYHSGNSLSDMIFVISYAGSWYGCTCNSAFTTCLIS